MKKIFMKTKTSFKRKNGVMIALFVSFVLSSFSMAQEDVDSAVNVKGPKQTKAKEGKKTTTIDFEDELVEGEFKKPELFYLLQRKQFNYKRLIKLRKDFIPEMKQTAEDVDDVEGGSK